MPKKSLARKLLEGLYSTIVFLLGLLFRGAKFIAGIAWSALRKLFSIAASSFSTASNKAVSKVATAVSKKPEFKELKEVKVFEGNSRDFEEWLYSSKSTVGLVLGARGSGKSGLGLRLLENWAFSGRKVFAMGFESAALPPWISCVNSIDSVSNNSVVLVDEGGLSFNSRDSMSESNKLLSKLLFIARHKDVSILFISQNSSNIEVNTIRQADYLLLKKPSLLQTGFERDRIKEIYAQVASEFKELSESEKGLLYAYSDKFRGFASNELPSFWSERASKAFKNASLGKSG